MLLRTRRFELVEKVGVLDMLKMSKFRKELSTGDLRVDKVVVLIDESATSGSR